MDSLPPSTKTMLPFPLKSSWFIACLSNSVIIITSKSMANLSELLRKISKNIFKHKLECVKLKEINELEKLKKLKISKENNNFFNIDCNKTLIASLNHGVVLLCIFSVNMAMASKN